MAYVKQNFETGQILTAEMMNHIEEGIEGAEKAIPKALPNPESVVFVGKSGKGETVGYNGQSTVTVEIPDDEYIFSVIDGMVRPMVKWASLPDRPFGQVGVDGEVLGSTQVVFEEGQGVIAENFALEAGAEYIVTWNGVQYRCMGKIYAIEGMDVVWLGNLGGMGLPFEASDEPFIIGRFPDSAAAEMGAYGAVFSLEGAEQATVSIEGIATVMRIDEKFMPESVAALIDEVARLRSEVDALKGQA